MEINYEKEMNKRNEKIPYEKEMNKRNEKIPYEKEMNKRNEKIPDQILRIVLGGQLLISTLKLFFWGGREGGTPTLISIQHYLLSSTSIIFV